jgi:peptide/nickel transport system substrate-binding protein
MVDPKGRQLPYIDRVVSTLETDPQVRALRMLNGEVDAEWRLLDVDDLSLYMKGQKSGNYEIKFWPQGIGSRSAVLPNWDARDPVLRKLIRDKRFRRALSYAIPRKEINLTVWRGLGVPQNAVVSAEAWHFQSPEGRRIYEEWRRVYSEFDPDKSNRLLDDIGLKRDKKGRRLRPDGKQLSLIVQAYPARMWAHEADEVALFADVWTKRLGIKTYVTTPPVPEIYRRLNSGDFEIGMWDESEMDLFTMPDWVFPTSNSYWHPLTGKWYQTGGKQGWPPTGSMKDLVDIFDRIKSEPDIEKCHKLVYEAIRIHINEGPFSLGTVGQLPALVLVKNNFHNVPDRGGVVGPWPMAQPGASHSEQFFIEGAQ